MHNTSLLLSRAYEYALCSSYAHGLTLCDFRFPLPQPEDIVTLIDGTRDIRANTSFDGFLAGEREHHRQLTSSLSSRFLHIPPFFTEDTDTIHNLHCNDLSDIAFGLLREKKVTPQHASLFSSFIEASFAFHEALLHATAALPLLSSPEIAHRFLYERPTALAEALFSTQETLSLICRRFSHPAFVELIEQGANDQVKILLTIGEQLGTEKEFFTRQLSVC